MVNPDGVIIGNHRASLTGVDLNRKFTVLFKNSDKDLFPEVEAVKDFIRSLNKSHKIELLLDLHGHSAKSNIFAYGEKQ
jgi:murein tripeptide amidase MpaA